MQKLIHGDCAGVLKTIESNSVDLVCTDPPYGYSFMGKDWDKAVPSVEIWRECFRVLKPGAFAFVMSAPRQDVLSQMIVRLGEAGFDTGFTSIYWTYASGFPKAMNIGKMVDKRLGTTGEVIGEKRFGKTSTGQGSGWNDNAVAATGRQDVHALGSPEAIALDGSYGGFQPKPAVEIIIVAMKPLSEKTYVDQALKNGKGVTWLDDCRVPTAELTPRNNHGGEYVYDHGTAKKEAHIEPHPAGRFPANLLVSDDILNDGKVTKSTKDSTKHAGREGTSTFAGDKQVERVLRGDSGSYSRFFSLDAWAANLPEHVRKVFPFLIVPKASKREKNAGLEGFEEKPADAYAEHRGRRMEEPERFDGKPLSVGKNTHATVKPITLMSYLITLGSREGDVVLEPFAGSGTTCIAAKALGRQFIGIEREAEYIKIAEARINALEGERVEVAEFVIEPHKEELKATETDQQRRSRLIDEELAGRKLTAEEIRFVNSQ